MNELIRVSDWSSECRTKKLIARMTPSRRTLTKTSRGRLICAGSGPGFGDIESGRAVSVAALTIIRDQGLRVDITQRSGQASLAFLGHLPTSGMNPGPRACRRAFRRMRPAKGSPERE